MGWWGGRHAAAMERMNSCLRTDRSERCRRCLSPEWALYTRWHGRKSVPARHCCVLDCIRDRVNAGEGASTSAIYNNRMSTIFATVSRWSPLLAATRLGNRFYCAPGACEMWHWCGDQHIQQHSSWCIMNGGVGKDTATNVLDDIGQHLFRMPTADVPMLMVCYDP